MEPLESGDMGMGDKSLNSTNDEPTPALDGSPSDVGKTSTMGEKGAEDSCFEAEYKLFKSIKSSLLVSVLLLLVPPMLEPANTRALLDCWLALALLFMFVLLLIRFVRFGTFANWFECATGGIGIAVLLRFGKKATRLLLFNVEEEEEAEEEVLLLLPVALTGVGITTVLFGVGRGVALEFELAGRRWNCACGRATTPPMSGIIAEFSEAGMAPFRASGVTAGAAVAP